MKIIALTLTLLGVQAITMRDLDNSRLGASGKGLAYEAHLNKSGAKDDDDDDHKSIGDTVGDALKEHLDRYEAKKEAKLHVDKVTEALNRVGDKIHNSTLKDVEHDEEDGHKGLIKAIEDASDKRAEADKARDNKEAILKETEKLGKAVKDVVDAKDRKNDNDRVKDALRNIVVVKI